MRTLDFGNLVYPVPSTNIVSVSMHHKYMNNDACVLAGKPNIHGSIYQFDGYATVFHPGKGPCYRCLYPEPPPPGAVPSCDEAGVLGVLPRPINPIRSAMIILSRLLVFKNSLWLLMVYLNSAIRRNNIIPNSKYENQNP